MSEFMSVKELYDRLEDPSVVIIDCRFNLTDKGAGRLAYEKGHLPGAFYMDLETDLSSPVQEHGGRHPLPDVMTFSKKLSEIGVDASKTVVAYDDQNGSMASRLWWLLRYYGHDQVKVLVDGFSEWVAEGYPVTKEFPQAKPVTFTPDVKEDWVVDVEAVKNRSEDVVLLDARAPERFRGEVEPLDKKAGHIPGAKNWFWLHNLENGKWKSAETLKAQFEEFQDRPVTLYCGSGVSACANFLAMTEAGLSHLKLYPGSWSDWISYDDHLVETGEEK